MDTLVKKIFDIIESSDETTPLGEKMAIVELKSGRYLEIVHETSGLESGKDFWSIRYHMSSEEFDDSDTDIIGTATSNSSADSYEAACIASDMLELEDERLLD